MNSTRFSIIVSAFLSLVTLAGSQTPKRIAATTPSPLCKWIGKTTSQTVSFGTQRIVDSLVFELDRVTPLGAEYKLTGGKATWTAAGKFGDCFVSGGPYTFDVSPDSGDIGNLIIYADSSYECDGSFANLNNSIKRVVLNCSGMVSEWPPELFNFIIGVKEYDTMTRSDVLSGLYETAASGDSASYHWDMHLESGDTKLSVESGEYDTWLPSAGKDEKEIGNTIAFNAHLLEPDGSPACAKADSFKYELINVSHEPGVALNFPDAGKAKKDWDLHFIAEFNAPTDVMSPDRLSLTTKEGSDAVAFIPSFDWGAYGSLKVTAFMHGGKTITGFLKGHPDITEIPIPKRSNGSKIADKWKSDLGVTALSDDDDAEKDPTGKQGADGDGFTLYEEYRGFYENGKHIFGDPKKKDLFVYKTLDEFLNGLQLFRALTGLNVHYKLKSGEFDTKDRLMNFNHTEASLHKTEQHGLALYKIPAGRGNFTTAYGPPKNVDSVNISSRALVKQFRTLIEGSRKEITDDLSSTVAHELCHAVGVHHHGQDIDPEMTDYSSSLTESLDLVITENNSLVIDARWEDDRPYTHPITDPRYLAVWAGEHCGVEDCIMRYDLAFAYIPGTGTTSNIRYIVAGTERTGIFLCNQQLGTGVNLPGRNPRVRYGNATIGFCKSQIIVSDKSP